MALSMKKWMQSSLLIMLSVMIGLAPFGGAGAATASVDDLNFSVTQYLSRQATFGWTAPSGAEEVRIEQSPQAADEWTTANSGTIALDATSATVTDLTPGTDYKFRLVVTGGDDEGASAFVPFTTMPTYALSYSAGEGGGLTGETEQAVDYNESGTAVTAVPDSGYRFVRWSDGVTDATRIDMNVQSALQVIAEFASPEVGGAAVSDFSVTQYMSREAVFSWTAAAGAASLRIEQSPQAQQAWTAADTGVIAADAAGATVSGLEPGTDYRFRLIVIGGENAGQSNDSTFTTMPAYTLTYGAEEGGSVTGELEQTVDYRGNGTEVTAVPDDGFRFSGWSDGVLSASRTDLDVQSAMSVTAQFSSGVSDFSVQVYLSRQATFSWAQVEGATALDIEQSPLETDEWVTANTGGITADATGATVTGLTPATAYKFRLVVTGGEYEGTSNLISFTMMPTYSLTYSAGEGGSVTGDLEQTVDYREGGTTVTAIPDAGYRFVRWSDSVPDAERTDTDVTAIVQAVAEFATPEVGGDTVTDFADTRYMSRDASFSWTAVTGATSLRLEVSPLHEQAWTTADTGAIDVNAASATVTGLTPATEYKFRLIVMGGPHAGESNMRSFTTMPTYTLSYSAGEGGSVTGEPEQTVDYRGNGTTVRAVPDAGYRFNRWSDGIKSASRTDVNVTAELAVSAEFAQGRRGSTSSSGDDDSGSSGGGQPGDGGVTLNGGVLPSWATVEHMEEAGGKVTRIRLGTSPDDLQAVDGTLTVSVGGDAATVSALLGGAAVQRLAQAAAVIEIAAPTGIYRLPAAQLQLAELAGALGAETDELEVDIRIGQAPSGAAEQLAVLAEEEGFAVAGQPVVFTVTASYGGKTVEVTQFSAYVERLVPLPEDVYVSTAVVLEPDGTLRHVPTKIVERDGVYYAAVSSRTNSVYALIGQAVQFADMETHWAKHAVADLGSRLVVFGAGEDTYKPDEYVTRAEFAAILVRALGLKEDRSGRVFTDAPESAWYYGAVQAAQRNGLISGHEDGRFGPLEQLSREQAMAIAVKAMELTGLKEPGAEAGAGAGRTRLEKFTDAGEVSPWAAESVAYSLQSGVISGMTPDRLEPKSPVTRAQMAVIVQRLLYMSGLIGPYAITDFSDIQYLSREATFGWTAAMGATDVRVELSPFWEDEWTTANTGTLAPNATRATVKGLEPAADYKFRLVVEGGVNQGTSNWKSFTTMPTYTLTYGAGAGGSISGQTEQTTDYRGAGQTVTAVAEPGHRFVRWSDGRLGAERTDTDVTDHVNVSAEFAVGEFGATPVSDFADTRYLSREASFEWTAPKGATSVIIEVRPASEELWTTATTGTIPADAASATVTGLTPETEYFFRLVVTGGENEGESNFKSFIMMPTYSLKYSAGAGGSIRGASEQRVDYRESGSEVTAVAEAGYRFVRWSDGVTEATRADGDVTEPLDVRAEFAASR